MCYISNIQVCRAPGMRAKLDEEAERVHVRQLGHPSLNQKRVDVQHKALGKKE